MARVRSKPAQLQLRKEKGRLWMSYDGDTTDRVLLSPAGKWAAGVFPLMRGGSVILTNRRSKALRFATSDVMFFAVSDAGSLVLAEFGSGAHTRLHFCFFDGTIAFYSKVKNLIQSTGLSFSQNGKTCFVHYDESEPRRVDVQTLNHNPGRAERLDVRRKSGCLWLVLLAVVLTIIVMLLQN